MTSTTPVFETYDEGHIISEMMMLCVEAHYGQFDKAGRPYIFHTLAVMHKLRSGDEELQAIAVGHDVIEDGKLRAATPGGKRVRVTYQMLAERGMTDRVIDGIRCLTRIKDVPGMADETEEEYQTKVLSNWDAIRVKKCDLEHNMDVRRLKGVEEKDFARMRKYSLFYQRILNEITLRTISG